MDHALSPDDLVGRTLEDLLVSKVPLGGEELAGLGRPLFYDVVLLLAGGVRCWLHGDQLEPWNSGPSLEPLDTSHFGIDPSPTFRGCMVTKVSSADDGDLLIELDGRTTLQVVTDHGTQILLSAVR